MDIRVKEKSSCFISEQVRIHRLETLLYSRPLSRGSKCFALNFSYFDLRSKVLPLTLSSNVTTQPIKLVYWRSLFHLFGKTQIHLVFRSTFRRSATLGDAFVV